MGLSFSSLSIFIYFVYMSLVWMYICAQCACLLSVKVRRGHWIPWNWSYRGLVVSHPIWVTEIWSCGRTLCSKRLSHYSASDSLWTTVNKHETHLPGFLISYSLPSSSDLGRNWSFLVT